MLSVKSLSSIGILLHHHFFLTTSALPLETQRTPPPTLSKRADFEYLVCPGNLPLPPYPQAPVFMKAAHIDVETQAPTALTYTDMWGEQEYIFAREGLCSRAGCRCSSGSVVCDNLDDIYFSRVLYNWYATDCFATCTCELVRSPTPQIIDLTGEGKNVSVNVIERPGGRNVNTVNRLNPGGTAGGFAGCLAGEATGWTLKGLAKCCAGYSFHALTAQEAYETYGVAPFASDIIAAAVTIGVCIKNV